MAEIHSGEHVTEPRKIQADVTDTPAGYAREPDGTHPPLDYEPYKSTLLRHPKQPLLYLPHTITEITGPQLGPARILGEHDNDLTVAHEDEPIGERIIVSGRVSDTGASRCATRWSRSGRPTPRGATGTGGIVGRRRSTRTSAARAAH